MDLLGFLEDLCFVLNLHLLRNKLAFLLSLVTHLLCWHSSDTTDHSNFFYLLPSLIFILQICSLCIEWASWMGQFSPPRLDGDSMELPPSPPPSHSPAICHTHLHTARSDVCEPAGHPQNSLGSKRCALPTFRMHKLPCALSSTLPGNCSEQRRCL